MGGEGIIAKKAFQWKQEHNGGTTKSTLQGEHMTTYNNIRYMLETLSPNSNIIIVRGSSAGYNIHSSVDAVRVRANGARRRVRRPTFTNGVLQKPTASSFIQLIVNVIGFQRKTPFLHIHFTI
jgi:hypothetical protein